MGDTIYIIMFVGVAVLIGVVFVVLGISKHVNMKKKMAKCTEKTIAKVVEEGWTSHNYSSSAYSDGFNPPVHQYTYEYYVRDKKIWQFSDASLTGPLYGLEVGQELEIYYNPKKPKEFYVAKANYKSMITTSFIIIGIIAIVITILSMFFIFKII